MCIQQSIQLNIDAPYRAEPVDIWGIGVILFTLLVGSMNIPLVSPDTTSYSRQIRHGMSPHYTARNSAFTYLEKSYMKGRGSASVKMLYVRKTQSTRRYADSRHAALITGLLNIDPEARLTLSEVHQHQWCMRYVNPCCLSSSEPLIDLLPSAQASLRGKAQALWQTSLQSP